MFVGTAEEIQVFCDMTGASTGCGGGGWTLVTRMDGHKVWTCPTYRYRYIIQLTPCRGFPVGHYIKYYAYSYCLVLSPDYSFSYDPNVVT